MNIRTVIGFRAEDIYIRACSRVKLHITDCVDTHVCFIETHFLILAVNLMTSGAL